MINKIGNAFLISLFTKRYTTPKANPEIADKTPAITFPLVRMCASPQVNAMTMPPYGMFSFLNHFSHAF